MPSSAPTVSKAAGRAAQGRPEAWEFEGPRLLPAARAVEASGHGRRHPAASAHGLPTQSGRGGRRGSGTVAPVCVEWLPPETCVAGPRPAGQDSRVLRSFATIGRLLAFQTRGLLGKPRAPCRHLGVPGGGNMAPSRGQCTREPRLHLPPGSGAG